MKIIHSSGRELKLKPGTVLEMERTNPFFNEYGEQSIPIKIPDDDWNKQTLGFPDDLANTKKIPQRTDAMIQEGVFSIRCRQAILSAGSEDDIDTSFYLNIGSFYEKMKDLQLSTVFKDKMLKFTNVQDAIRFVRGLMVTPDPRFACFPILVKSKDTGEITVLNRVSEPIRDDGYFSLYNETDRSVVVGENTISVPAGYYITPLIKTMHLLTEAFKYMGYVLEESFFSKTSPFSDMVFLNNNIDTIVNSEIRYDQIIPNCNVSTILDIFRNKFCCEFIPDEVRRTIRIELFNEISDRKPIRDLTNILTSEPIINHSAKFKQVKLSCEIGPMLDYVADESGNSKLQESAPGYLSKTIPEIASQYPEAVIDIHRGWIYRDGFAGLNVIREIVGCLNCDYYAGGTLEAEKKESPDVMVNIDSYDRSNSVAPFVGSSRSFNSNIILNNTPSKEGKTTDKSKEDRELKPMLCFVAHARSFRNDFGTIYGYVWNQKFWDYSLAYNGADGLYEKFWRKYDDMLRNSFRPVTCKLLLTDMDKLNLSAFEKICLKNQDVLPNIIKYNIGKKTVTECTFLTTKLYEPLSSAMSEGQHFPDSTYGWQIRSIRKGSYNNYEWYQLKETPNTFFPPPPTEQQYLSRGRYYEKDYAAIFGDIVTTDKWGHPEIIDPVDGIYTIWLEPIIRVD